MRSRLTCVSISQGPPSPECYTDNVGFIDVTRRDDRRLNLSLRSYVLLQIAPEVVRNVVALVKIRLHHASFVAWGTRKT